MDTRARAGDAKEDQVTGAIERVTAQVPSVTFLGLAVSAMAASLVLKLTRRDGWANFVGQWAPSLMILGLYNKMVKQQGSDAESNFSSAGPRPQSVRPNSGKAATI